MFNLTGSELVVILLVALVVLGPEKLPEAIRRVGRIYAELRKMSSGFQEEFTSAIREPLNEVRSTSQMVTQSLDFTAKAPTDEAPTDEAPTDEAPTSDAETEAAVDDTDTGAAEAAPSSAPIESQAPVDDAPRTNTTPSDGSAPTAADGEPDVVSPERPGSDR